MKESGEDFVQAESGNTRFQKPTDEEIIATAQAVGEAIDESIEDPSVVSQLLPDWLVEPGGQVEQDIEQCAPVSAAASGVGTAVAAIILAGVTLPAGGAGALLAPLVGSLWGAAAGGACLAGKNQKRKKKQKELERLAAAESEATVPEFLSWFGIQSEEIDALIPEVSMTGSAQPAKGSNPTQFAVETRSVELGRLQEKQAARQAQNLGNTAALAVAALAAFGAYKLSK